MLKFLVLFLNLIGFLIFELFSDEVNVTIKAPENIQAGNSFVVEVTVSKPNLSGFARYQQAFPTGYSVKVIKSNNGDAVFKDQKFKIIWYKIPEDSIFTISYTVFTEPNVTGTLNLNGIFNYIQNNEVKTYNIESKIVTIMPAPQQVNNNTPVIAEKINASEKPIAKVDSSAEVKPLQKMDCTRQFSQNSKNEIIVKLTVNTIENARGKSAKIEEKVPVGFNAVNIDGKDGIFSFKNNTVSYIWMNLPTQSSFEISYKLISSVPVNVYPDVSGSISYIENGLSKMNSVQTNELLNTPLIVEVKQPEKEAEKPPTVTPKATAENIVTTPKPSQVVVNPVKVVNENKPVQKQIAKTNSESEVLYRIQIAAGHRPVNTSSYFKKFNISEGINTEEHDGWRKYTIGSFNIYKDARDRRVEVWNTTPIHDAFVSAYNKGKRITVQEALMIANQKWYQ
jgi:hypothetical protein